MAALPAAFADRLSRTPQSGDGYWVVVVRMRDGREFGGIGIVDGEMVDTPVPIEPGDVIAIGLETGVWVELDEATALT